MTPLTRSKISENSRRYNRLELPLWTCRNTMWTWNILRCKKILDLTTCYGSKISGLTVAITMWTWQSTIWMILDLLKNFGPNNSEPVNLFQSKKYWTCRSNYNVNLTAYSGPRKLGNSEKFWSKKFWTWRSILVQISRK